MAQLAYAKGDLTSAESHLNKAKSLKADASEVNTNLALIALAKNDIATAESYLAKGSGANSFKEVMGNLQIAKGNYQQAAGNLNGVNTNSAALAQILNKDYAAAKNTLNNVKNADAYTAYLKAIVAARTNDASGVSSNLRTAIQKDSSLAKRAAIDLEFANFASTIESLVK